MLVAGAVAGGGLTVIANAPNPAGVALLRNGFSDGAIGVGGLLLGASLPTVAAALFFRYGVMTQCVGSGCVGYPCHEIFRADFCSE